MENGLADFYRRSGIPPCPEEIIFGLQLKLGRCKLFAKITKYYLMLFFSQQFSLNYRTDLCSSKKTRYEREKSGDPFTEPPFFQFLSLNQSELSTNKLLLEMTKDQ